MKSNLIFCLMMIGTVILSGCRGYRWSGHYQHDDSLLNVHHDWAAEPYFPSTSDPDNDLTFKFIKDQWRLRSENYSFKFQTVPPRPKWNEKVILKLSIYDVSESTPTPVTSAKMICQAKMQKPQPGMHKIWHNYIVHENHFEKPPGVYSMLMLFGVGGNWVIHYEVEFPNGKKFPVSFPLLVKRSGDPAEEWEKMKPKVPK